jgi:acetyl-CoA acetyltransferase
MPTLKDKAAIAGIGNTTYSRNSGVSVLALAAEACKRAIDDAGIPTKEVDGIVTYNVGDSVSPEYVAACLGLPRLRYHMQYWGGGPASQQVVATAAIAVATGMANNVICFRALNGRSGRRPGGTGERPEASGESQFAIPFGFTNFVQMFAFWATRHMALYGTTEEQLGSVAITTREYAVMNERAVMRKPMTMEDYLRSRMIAWPLRLFDICLETDGACALLVTSAERARDMKHRPIYVMAAAHGGGPATSGHDENLGLYLRWKEHTEFYGKHIAPDLYGMAGITPQDIDVAEIYDDMTIAVIFQLEDFGFCKKGEGGPFVADGNTKLTGKLPTNTHGGLMSEAYIHGLNHTFEAVSQLRGDAGPRQVKNAEIALTTGMGAAVGSALILRR